MPRLYVTEVRRKAQPAQDEGTREIETSQKCTNPDSPSAAGRILSPHKLFSLWMVLNLGPQIPGVRG